MVPTGTAVSSLLCGGSVCRLPMPPAPAHLPSSRILLQRHSGEISRDLVRSQVAPWLRVSPYTVLRSIEFAPGLLRSQILSLLQRPMAKCRAHTARPPNSVLQCLAPTSLRAPASRDQQQHHLRTAQTAPGRDYIKVCALDLDIPSHG